MRIAIPVHNGRVSPVFDTAQHILTVDIEAGEGAARAEHDAAAISPWQRAKLLSEHGVSHLICGAISFRMMSLLESHGITVKPNTAGDVDEVLEAFMRGTLLGPRFMMPGCFGRSRSRGRCRHGQGPRCL